MASKLTLKNDINTEFSIIHNDGSKAKTIASNDMVQVVDTIADMVAILNCEDGQTVIVRDINQGGTFIWSATGTANGGTVFAGATGYWNRQYDGAVNVKWFGAVGDGVTDDTVAIQNAIDSGYPVFVPKGIYKTTSKIDIINNGTEFIGAGRGQTIFKPYGSFNVFEIGGRGNLSTWKGDIQVGNFSIDGTYHTGGNGLDVVALGLRSKIFGLKITSIYGVGLYISSSFDHIYDDIEIRQCGGLGLHIYEKQSLFDGVYEEISYIRFNNVSALSNNSLGTQAELAGGDTIDFNDCKFSEGSIGLHITRNCSAIKIDGLMCDGLYLATPSVASNVVRIDPNYAQNISITNTRAYACGDAILINNGRDIYVSNVSKVEGTGADVKIVTSEESIIVDNNIVVDNASPFYRCNLGGGIHKNVSTVEYKGNVIVETISTTLPMTAYAAATLVNIPYPSSFSEVLSLNVQRNGYNLLQRWDGAWVDVLTEISMHDGTSCDAMVKLVGNASTNQNYNVPVTITVIGVKS